MPPARPETPVLAPCLCSVRGSLITVLWALSTMAVSSVSYVATRTSGNLADCSQEHVIMNILKASLCTILTSLPLSSCSPHGCCGDGAHVFPVCQDPVEWVNQVQPS